MRSKNLRPLILNTKAGAKVFRAQMKESAFAVITTAVASTTASRCSAEVS